MEKNTRRDESRSRRESGEKRGGKNVLGGKRIRGSRRNERSILTLIGYGLCYRAGGSKTSLNGL